MKKQTIQTADAPQAIGTYSQAIRAEEETRSIFPARSAWIRLPCKWWSASKDKSSRCF